MRFSQALKKRSRSFEMETLPGRCPIQLQRWNDMVSKGSAKPIFRDPHDRRQLVAKPKGCFDNGPIRLLVQTRPRTLSGNPGAR